MTTPGRRVLKRWAWPALATVLALAGALLALALFQDFAADIRQARQRATLQMQLITDIVAGQLKDDHYDEIEPLLGRIGEADDTIAAIQLSAVNGFVIATYQADRALVHSFALDAPIAYSYHRAAVLRLEVDLDGVYARDRRLAVQLGCIYAALCLLLGLLTHIALRRAAEAAQLRLADAQLRASNRTLRVLSNCNQALVRADSEQELMDDMCRILVVDGGYALAWIGLADQDAQRRIRCAASSGATDYAQGLNLNWGQGEGGQGPTAVAIRTGQTVINRDTATNSTMWPWRAAAEQFHLRSSIALPLGTTVPAFGALNIYAGATGQFDEDELRLLTELASDLSYGLQSLRNEVRRIELETAQQEANERFEQIAANVSEVFWVSNISGFDLLYVSAAYEKVWQRRIADLRHEPQQWLEAIHPDDRRRVRKAVAEKQVQGTFDEEYRIVRPDGSIRWIRDRAFPVRNARGEVYRVVGTAEDITEAKNAHLQIQYLNRIYALLSGINSLIVRVRNREELFREVCRLAIESGQFRMAWIGMVDAASRRVQPVAWSGDAREILDGAPLGIDAASGADYGLVGEALDTRSLMLCNDVADDPRLVLRDVLHERGLKSLAVMPLVVAGRAVGVFVLYSSERGFFDTAEERLLRELSGDIAFALEHMEKSEKIDYLAFYDQLTGLPNRSLFHERVTRRLDAGRAGPGTAHAGHCAIILLDVDRFRAVNDSLGRLAGDELIRQIANRLALFAGDPELLARTGANQFGVLLPGTGDAEQCADVLVRLFKACFDLPFQLSDAVELRIAVKAGIALAPGDGADAEILLRNAEAALKKAKVSGERYLFYAPQMNEKVAEKLSLENRLQAALQRDEFVLHYQPKIDLRTGTVTGVEALIRWQSPDLGLVQPLQFIPILEETGLILEVGNWVIRRAAADYREWRVAGIPAPRIAVNVSAVQLRRADFVQSLREALAPDPQAAGVDIELTESLLMENIDENVKKLEAARDMGIRIAIDDFGTGYSSLRYLAMLPAHQLKIDRSFVITMLDDPNVLTLVSTIISMAHSLGLEVVAEGVDQVEQAQSLRDLGCDQLQGYLASRPIAKEALLALLRTRPDGLNVLAPTRTRLPLLSPASRPARTL